MNDTRHPAQPQIRQMNGWTVRERRPAGPGPHRALLLLHGWTGDENSMWIFTSRLPKDAWLIAPRAPYPSVLGGYSWRDDTNLGAGVRRWPALDDFAPALRDLLALLTPENFPGAELEQFEAAGFSQGGALMYALALQHPQRIRRLAGLATFMPQGVEVLLLRRPLMDLPVFVAHGSQDETVPLALARQSVEKLEEAGALVQYCESNVGHKLGMDCFRALAEFFG